IIEKARVGEINHIVVWAFDRWIRDRDTLLEDVTTLLSYGVKLHSVKDSWFESINIEGSLGKTIREFMLGLIGSIAQMESERRSERILLGKKNTTVKQGRKEVERDIELILKLHSQGLSTYKIAEEYNKQHRPHISHQTIFNLIKKLTPITDKEIEREISE
ncbi:MAG: recombinase family protein, partial [Candidatus Pacearchaeota archaeon]|nr:recombinase family protein [Candidatus Pacearchaeota archaeon]